MSYFSIMECTKEELQERIQMYLSACEKTATVPTNKEFAKSIGYTPGRLRQIRRNNPDTFQGQLLEMFADTCCEILIQGGLNDTLNAKMAKFIANPHLTMRDSKKNSQKIKKTKWVKGEEVITKTDYKGTKLYPDIYYCPFCGEEAYWDTDYGQQLFDYCPYCGEPMKEDGDK